MPLTEHYVAIKHAHVALATCSVALFAARGIGVQMRARWPMLATVRRASVVLDTLLITAGGTLWWMLSLSPRRDLWLLAKLILIVVYIGLGSLALKRAPTQGARRLALIASLACAGAVASIALGHGLPFA